METQMNHDWQNQPPTMETKIRHDNQIHPWKPETCISLVIKTTRENWQTWK